MAVNRRSVIFAILVVLILFTLSEGLSFLLGTCLKKKGWVYAPQLTETYSTYLARLNPRLGWPSQASFGHDDFDLSGSRMIPAFPDFKKDRSWASIYGDSFAWGEEVDNAHAWGNVLSTLLNCRVSNYGVCAYGTDQAYLRFHYNNHDNSPVVIMVFSSDNITRNVNQLRNLISPGPQCALKPRFILDNQGKLREIPIPPLTASDYQKLINHPDIYLKHEFFLPGGPSDVQTFQFPFSLRILRLTKPLFLRVFSGTRRYAAFYQPDHPSHALQVSTEILKAFSQEAKKRGQSPLVLFLPILEDVMHYKKTHQWVSQPLLDNLDKCHIKFLNVGPDILHYLGKHDPQEIFNHQGGGHLNEEGYRLLAHIVYDYLCAQHLTQETRSGPAL